MKYEYKVEIVKTGLIFDSNKKQEAQLNSLGQQGYKLVSVMESKKYFKYIFIKKIA